MPSHHRTLALERVTPDDGSVLERLAAKMLAVEHPSLRTMASPAGVRDHDDEFWVDDIVLERVHEASGWSAPSTWEHRLLTFEADQSTLRASGDARNLVFWALIARSPRTGPTHPAADSAFVLAEEWMHVPSRPIGELP